MSRGHRKLCIVSYARQKRKRADKPRMMGRFGNFTLQLMHLHAAWV
jgi:hypothetical protein